MIAGWPNGETWPDLPVPDTVVPEVDDLADPEPELLDHRGRPIRRRRNPVGFAHPTKETKP